MADFLRFKGAKSVTKQQGDEMSLRRPPNGGDTWQTKRWWGGKGKVVYIKAAIFSVTSSVGNLQLVIPTDNETTAVSIRHDGAGNFTFSDFRGLDRVAVYNSNRSELMAEYQFPSISGGSVLKRTLQPFSIPAPPAPPTPPPPSFDDLFNAATFTYTVTVDNGNFELNGLANASVAGAVGDSFGFDLSDPSNAGHPLQIYTDSSKTTKVTVGVLEEGDRLLFTPPIAGTFSYQCENHAGMGGDITVS